MLLLRCYPLHAFRSLHLLPLFVCRCALLRNTSYPFNRVYMLVLPMSLSSHASPAFSADTFVCHAPPFLSPSLVALFSFFCVSIIFIFLSTSHYLSRPDICRLPITIGFCFYIPHRHLIDSSFLLVSCTLPSRIAPLGRFLRYCVARSSCRVPTRLVESTIIIMFRPAHRLRVTLQCGSPVQRRIRCSVHHFHVIPSPLYSIFRGFARGGTGTRICILPTVDPAVCRCRSKATSLS